ncbi:MAG: HD domain-containing protein [Bacteroidota bacterium]|nr:HD domain-containing protein [Bacteroidota bacterium]
MSLIRRVEEYVRSLLSQEPVSAYPYHNLNHTMSVVSHAKEIGQHEDIDELDFKTLLISAWFHDIGYTRDYKKHELKGAEIAREFLGSMNHRLVEKVESSIISTRLPQSPANHVEMILCDADMFHLSEDGLIESSDKLRREINMVLKREMSLTDYLQGTLKLLKSHQYFSAYARKTLEIKKVKNINIIREYLADKS